MTPHPMHVYITKAVNGTSFITLACIAESPEQARDAFTSHIDDENLQYSFNADHIADIGPPHYSELPPLTVQMINAGDISEALEC